jgi:hypothetical protein
MGTSGRHTRTTVQRGLGGPHQARVRQLLEKHTDGDPCEWCTEPMYKAQGLQGDHRLPRSRGGQLPDRLLHGWCNSQRRDAPELTKAEWLANKGQHGNTDHADLGVRVLAWP